MHDVLCLALNRKMICHQLHRDVPTVVLQKFRRQTLPWQTWQTWQVGSTSPSSHAKSSATAPFALSALSALSPLRAAAEETDATPGQNACDVGGLRDGFSIGLI